MNSNRSHVPTWVQRGLAGIRTMRARSRTRSELLNMDARMRADIGITWMEAFKEASKPFWKA